MNNRLAGLILSMVVVLVVVGILVRSTRVASDIILAAALALVLYGIWKFRKVRKG